MCGIAGIVGVDISAAAQAVQRMTDAMAHRGPDGEGLWTSPSGSPVVFGHRRLSIIDLSPGGAQPMVDRASGDVIVFNGEIYNFQELRRDLAARGHAFESSSDTEVLLKAYAEFGEACLDRLRGMFAFAIREGATGRVFLARDRLGIKPLYLARVRDPISGRAGWAFASEVRAILASGLVPRRLSPRGLASYVWHGFVVGPDTIVEGISSLGPGQSVVLDPEEGTQRARTWWAPPAGPGERPATMDALRAQIEEAARLHLLADVPVASFLSGGIDSSVVTRLAQASASQPIRTFTIGVDSGEHDETGFARAVAEAIGTDHREIRLGAASIAERVDEALGSLDQPSFDAINTYFVSRAVRDAGYKVALAGTGGDELFGGYRSFQRLPRLHRLNGVLGRCGARGAAAGLAAALFGAGCGSRSKLADALGAGGDLLGLYQSHYALFSRTLHMRLLRRPPGGMLGGLPEETGRVWSGRATSADDILAGVALLELGSFLGERLLRDTDAASMAASIETRVPLVDHEVVEHALRLPTAARFERLGSKLPLRRAGLEGLDPALFDRRKSGFELPMARWMIGPWHGRIRDGLGDPGLCSAAGLDPSVVGSVLRAFEANPDRVYWSRPWSLFVLVDWCRRHGVALDGGADAPSAVRPTAASHAA